MKALGTVRRLPPESLIFTVTVLLTGTLMYLVVEAVRFNVPIAVPALLSGAILP